MDDPLRVLKLGRLLNRQLQVSIRLRIQERGVQSSASFHLRSAPPTHVSGAYRRGRDGRSVEGEGNQKRERTLPYSLPLRVNLGYRCSQTFAERAPWAWPRTPDLASRVPPTASARQVIRAYIVSRLSANGRWNYTTGLLGVLGLK